MPSLVLLRGDGWEKWYHLNRGRKSWALRDFLEGDGTPAYYQRDLADFSGHIVQELSLQEVEKRTGRAVSGLAASDPANRPAWRQVCAALATESAAGTTTAAEGQPPGHVAPMGVEGHDIPEQPEVPIARVVPVTELHSLYSVLEDFSKREFQLAMAREAARAPVAERLARRFRNSVGQCSRYVNEGESFHPERLPLPEINPAEEITTTETLTRHLYHHNNGEGRVVDEQEMDFALVDYEVDPLRTTGLRVFANGELATRGKRLDWLLTNTADHRMIVAEVKIDGDKNPFFALIQSLMYSAELVTNSQLARLTASYPDHFAIPEPGEGDYPAVPVCDIYLVLHKYDFEDDIFNGLLEVTSEVSRRLMQRQEVSNYIRRIACLDARRGEGGRLFFYKLFSHGG